MEPLRRDSTSRRLVAVFRSQADARAASEALRRSGVSVDHDQRDDLAALRGEMYEEMQHTVGAPGFGGVTREMQRGIIPAVPIAMVIGGAIGALLGVIPWADVALGTRALIGAAVGVVAGAPYGFWFGGGLSWRLSVDEKHLAAEDGTAIGAWANGDDDVERVVGILDRYHPIRIDQVTPEGHPLRTVEDNAED